MESCFQLQSYSFFISVFVYPTLHTFPVTVLFLLYFCICLSNSPYFSSDSPIPSLFLYLFIQLSILFQWQSYSFFISVFIYPTLHTFPVTVLFLLYFCICLSNSPYLSSDSPIPSLFLYLFLYILLNIFSSCVWMEYQLMNIKQPTIKLGVYTWCYIYIFVLHY
jgi:hypothetical protein